MYINQELVFWVSLGLVSPRQHLVHLELGAHLMLPGKTIFLIYILVIRLGQKQPVALQFLDGRQRFALFQDTLTFHEFDDIELLDECPSGFVWALCDSNDDTRAPSGVFKGRPESIRIIQTASPRPKHWKKWTRHVGARCYFMDIWSDEEVVHLA